MAVHAAVVVAEGPHPASSTTEAAQGRETPAAHAAQEAAAVRHERAAGRVCGAAAGSETSATVAAGCCSCCAVQGDEEAVRAIRAMDHARSDPTEAPCCVADDDVGEEGACLASPVGAGVDLQAAERAAVAVVAACAGVAATSRPATALACAYPRGAAAVETAVQTR